MPCGDYRTSYLYPTESVGIGRHDGCQFQHWPCTDIGCSWRWRRGGREAGTKTMARI